MPKTPAPPKTCSGRSCAAAQLVTEIDEAAHDTPHHDSERQAQLETLGLRVLRFQNADGLDHIEEVLAATTATLESADNRPSIFAYT